MIFIGIFLYWFVFGGSSLMVYGFYVRGRYFNRRRKDYLGNFYKNSFNFLGKTSRRDFWITQGFLLYFYLFYFIVGLLIYNPNNYEDPNEALFAAIWIFSLLIFFSVISLIPNFAIQVRRLRDAGINPFWILIIFIPYIGQIPLFILCAYPSRKKRLPITLRDRLSEIEDLLTKGTIDEEEYKYMRKQILINHTS